jgi:ABC-type branched-subunit amino acid transport system substrate-binding protein
VGRPVCINDVRDAFKLATDKINAKGGVMGRKIEVVTRDSKFKVDLGLAAAKELVLRENVDILLGTINNAFVVYRACLRDCIEDDYFQRRKDSP